MYSDYKTFRAYKVPDEVVIATFSNYDKPTTINCKDKWVELPKSFIDKFI
jgi:hypothetical protein